MVYTIPHAKSPLFHYSVNPLRIQLAMFENLKKFHFIPLAGCFLSAMLPAQAQTNPPLAACGLPAGGPILTDVTYTLTADCSQTSLLTIASRNPGITVTIHGAGHTIHVAGDFNFISTSTNSVLNLNNLTLDGGNFSHSVLVNGESINTNHVTIRRNAGGVVMNAKNLSLSHTLFESNSINAFSIGGNGSALLVKSGATATLNGVVFRNNYGGGGAVTVHGGGTLTANGCLTLSGNAPYDIYGTWTDHSTGLCTGTIGNDGPAQLPAPQPAACGFPEGGILDASATYTLNADCTLNANLILSEDVSITVNGNGRRISGAADTPSIITAATSTLIMNDLFLNEVRFTHFGNFRAERFVVDGLRSLAFFNMGTASFNNVRFENIIVPQRGASAIIAWNAYRKGDTILSNAVVRNTEAQRAALWNVGSSFTLEGCITFENNTPANTLGTFVDHRSGDCAAVDIEPAIPNQLIVPSPDNPAPKHSHKWEVCQRLGAIGIFCRVQKRPGPTIEVWGVTLNSQGYFILEVRQAQVDATRPPQAMVACAADGRVAVRVWADRNVTVSMGPSPEGKTHHVTLAKRLNGEVIGTVDTHDGLPCSSAALATNATPAQPALAPWATPQEPRADGSLVHVVQPDDTLHSIAVAYGLDPLVIVARNQLEGGGRWIFPGQELLILSAPGE